MLCVDSDERVRLRAQRVDEVSSAQQRDGIGLSTSLPHEQDMMGVVFCCFIFSFLTFCEFSTVSFGRQKMTTYLFEKCEQELELTGTQPIASNLKLGNVMQL